MPEQREVVAGSSLSDDRPDPVDLSWASELPPQTPLPSSGAKQKNLERFLGLAQLGKVLGKGP